jgi:hypothetical protein
MLSEEIDETSAVLKNVSIMLNEQMCDEDEAQIVQFFEARIAQEFKQGFEAYKAQLEEESDEFDIDAAETLEDYVGDTMLERGLDRLQAYAELYYLIRIAQRHAQKQDRPLKNIFALCQNDPASDLKLAINSDLKLHITGFLLDEGESPDSYDSASQGFDVDEEHWTRIENIRALIKDAERITLKPSEIMFLMPVKLEAAIAATRVDLEMSTAIRNELTAMSDDVFLYRRALMQNYLNMTKPFWEIFQDNALTEKATPSHFRVN